MRICFTSPSQTAYSETFIQNLKNGIDGEIFHCFGGYFPSESEDKELKNHRLPKTYHRVLRKLNLLKKPIDQLYLGDYLKSKKIDLIFANYGPSGAVIVPVVKSRKIPLIVHFHGFDASIFEITSKYKESYLEMFKVAKAIIVVSDEMKKDLINLGAPENKLKKIICAPNADFLKIQPNYDSNQIIAIGRFVEKKAPYLTLMAYQSVKKTCPEVRLKLVGDGPLLSVCMDLVKSLCIEDVEFTGILNPAQIQHEMSQSFCFIQHSKQASNGDKEGTPVAIMEALAAGLPVVSTKHAGIPEVVIDGENGFVVEEGDVGKMAEKIIQISQDRQLAERFGKNGKLLIQQKYNSIVYFKSINDVIFES